MSGITLVFTICSVIVAGAHFALVNGAAAPYRPANLYQRNSHAIGVQGQCYSCEGCDEFDMDNATKIEKCPVIRDFIPGCISYSELNTNSVNGDEWVVRGCAATLGSCEEIENKQLFILSCTQCSGDLCNYN